uniref:Tick transposon n=1 Tax=Rhipicephalus zambeziensis TaxID=60191 RepID=A0A224YT53_9ACAR
MRGNLSFTVLKSRQALTGLNTCINFGTVPVNINSARLSGNAGVKVQFVHLFHGMGCAQRKDKIVLRSNVIPVEQPVPLALKKPLYNELACIEKASIITKVEEHIK